MILDERPGAGTDALLSDLRAKGWGVRRGWSLPSATWSAARLRVVCVGALRTPADADAALLAAARGAGVVAFADAERQLVERFYEDLSRFGRVDVRRHRPRADPLPRLSKDQRRLLELLAGGLSVGAAADALFISRRTADRRLAAARATLGVGTTAEAVIVWAGCESAPAGAASGADSG